MIFKILKYPNPILRKKSEEVKEITEETKNLAFDMVETMKKNNGIGLAAPQVSESKRMFVIQTTEGAKIFINPQILKRTKETSIMEEGCLCFPGLFLKIKRARGVEIETLNEKGEKISFKTEGLPARVLQHEIDHLDGILFIDRIGFWQKLKLWKKLKEYVSNR